MDIGLVSKYLDDQASRGNITDAKRTAILVSIESKETAKTKFKKSTDKTKLKNAELLSLLEQLTT